MNIHFFQSDIPEKIERFSKFWIALEFLRKRNCWLIWKWKFVMENHQSPTRGNQRMNQQNRGYGGGGGGYNKTINKTIPTGKAPRKRRNRKSMKDLEIVNEVSFVNYSILLSSFSFVRCTGRHQKYSFSCLLILCDTKYYNYYFISFSKPYKIPRISKPLTIEMENATIDVFKEIARVSLRKSLEITYLLIIKVHFFFLGSSRDARQSSRKQELFDRTIPAAIEGKGRWNLQTQIRAGRKNPPQRRRGPKSGLKSDAPRRKVQHWLGDRSAHHPFRPVLHGNRSRKEGENWLEKNCEAYVNYPASSFSCRISSSKYSNRAQSHWILNLFWISCRNWSRVCGEGTDTKSRKELKSVATNLLIHKSAEINHNFPTLELK